MKRLSLIAALAAFAWAAAAAHASAGAVLDVVKARGHVLCGVHNPGLVGFGAPDAKGVWRGLDVDMCRAVAAAVFGDARKVKYVPLDADQRLAAVRNGTVDVLARNTTWTLLRESEGGVLFTVVDFYDGQGFLVNASSGIDSVRQLNGRRICVQRATTTESTLASYFSAFRMNYTPVVAESYDAAVAAFLGGQCEALTSDRSQLAVIRATRTKDPSAYALLADVISNEPLAPAVRQGDDQWFNIVKWSIYVTILAEEKGLTSRTVQALLTTGDPSLRLLLGVTPGLGESLGIGDRWAYNIIRQVGNYKEIFDRNLGSKSKLQLLRGVNTLWTSGGLLYSPPIR